MQKIILVHEVDTRSCYLDKVSQTLLLLLKKEINNMTKSGLSHLILENITMPLPK
jgi:hypothetical protein